MNKRVLVKFSGEALAGTEGYGPEATIGEILEVNIPRPRDRVALQSDKEYIRCREAILTMQRINSQVEFQEE